MPRSPSCQACPRTGCLAGLRACTALQRPCHPASKEKWQRGRWVGGQAHRLSSRIEGRHQSLCMPQGVANPEAFVCRCLDRDLKWNLDRTHLAGVPEGAADHEVHAVAHRPSSLKDERKLQSTLVYLARVPEGAPNHEVHVVAQLADVVLKILITPDKPYAVGLHRSKVVGGCGSPHGERSGAAGSN